MLRLGKFFSEPSNNPSFLEASRRTIGWAVLGTRGPDQGSTSTTKTNGPAELSSPAGTKWGMGVRHARIGCWTRHRPANRVKTHSHPHDAWLGIYYFGFAAVADPAGFV